MGVLDLAQQATQPDDPIEGLRAVSELRSGLDGLEADYVEEAVRSGLSWSRIAEALGVSRQGAHRRHTRRLKREPSAKSRGEPARPPVTMLGAGARRVVRFAREECESLEHPGIGSEHLLLGVLRCREGVATRALQDLGVSLTAARSQVGRLGSHAADRGGSSSHAQAGALLPTARTVLEQSLAEAVRSGNDRLEGEYLLRGLLKQDGAAVRVLERLGLSSAAVERRLSQLIASQGP
jgi:ClpA/ClpB-like protein